MSESRPQKQQDCALRLLPAYLDTHSIEEALQSARGRRIIWLEILINDRLDFTPWEQDPAFQEVYRTACRWYTQYSGLIIFLFDRRPLPADPGPIDFPTTASSPRRCALPTISTDHVIRLLEQFVRC
jgi:hypothetical protein